MLNTMDQVGEGIFYDIGFVDHFVEEILPIERSAK